MHRRVTLVGFSLVGMVILVTTGLHLTMDPNFQTEGTTQTREIMCTILLFDASATYRLKIFDTWGDGWNGGAYKVDKITSNGTAAVIAKTSFQVPVMQTTTSNIQTFKPILYNHAHQDIIVQLLAK